MDSRPLAVRTDRRPAARALALTRLLPLWPHEVSDCSATGRRRVVALLRRALRAERKRGLAGHWTYDLSRHAQLLALYRAECESLKPPKRDLPRP
jgi:hypothetical protein